MTLNMFHFLNKYFTIKEMASIRTQNLAYIMEVRRDQLNLYCELCSQTGKSNFHDKIIKKAYKYLEELEFYEKSLIEDIYSTFVFCVSNFPTISSDCYNIVVKYLREGNDTLEIYQQIKRKRDAFFS